MTLEDFNPTTDGEYTKKLRYRPASAYWEAISKWFAVLVLAVFPLLNGSQRYYNITESKYFYLNILEFGYLICCGFILLSYVMDKKLGARRWEGGRQKLDVPQIIIIAYFLSACISSFTSEYMSETFLGVTRFEGLISVFLYGIIFVFLSFWGEYHDIYAWSIAIMATLFGIISILEVCGIDMVSPDGLDYTMHHFVGTIGNVDMVSGFAALVIPVLGLSYVFLEGKLRYLAAVAYIMMLYIQLFIDVDSGKVGLFVGAVCALPFLFLNKKSTERSLMVMGLSLLAFGLYRTVIPKVTSVEFAADKIGLVSIAAAFVLGAVSVFLSRKEFEFRISEKKIALIVTVLIIIAAIAGAVWLYNFDKESPTILHQASRMMHGVLEDNFGTNRGYIWKNTWKEVLKHPVFGGGPGVFVKLFTNNSLNDGTQRAVVDFAHNDFLQIACCQGFVGLGIYLAFIVSMAVKGIRNAFKNKLTVIFMIACVSYLVHSFFSFSIAIITPLFWVLAGLMDKCIRQSDDMEREGPAVPEKKAKAGKTK